MTDKFTAEEKLACAQRELRMRRNVYPRWVSQEHMTQTKADHEIALMESICADYESLAAKERLL